MIWPWKVKLERRVPSYVEGMSAAVSALQEQIDDVRKLAQRTERRMDRKLGGGNGDQPAAVPPPGNQVRLQAGDQVPPGYQLEG